MSRCLLLITALLLSKPGLGAIVSGIVPGVVNGLVGVHRVVDGVADGVVEGVADIVSSLCPNVKKILGVNYNDADEPDLSGLQLDYYANDRVIKCKLTDMEQILNWEFFNRSSGMIIYMHGFTDKPSESSFQTLNNAFHEQGIYNILALDASNYIGYFYLRASTMVVYIGETLGEGITTLMQKGGLDLSKVHLIGHSLGSHIASHTAKTVYNMTGSKVGRVTGLDPAGPCFSNLNSSHRLNKTDATFVDVIHTDAGVYGLDENCGQVDYYPNSGSNQPGCVLNTCSHSRAWEYFAESVTNSTGFPAVKCDSWNSFSNGNCVNNSQSYMGYASEPGTTGEYYLRTNSASPYALGTEGI